MFFGLQNIAPINIFDSHEKGALYPPQKLPVSAHKQHIPCNLVLNRGCAAKVRTESHGQAAEYQNQNITNIANVLFQIARAINEEIHNFSCLMNTEAQRLLSDNLLEEANAYQDEKKEQEAYLAYYAGFLSTFSINNPDLGDYKRILNFEYRMLRSKKIRAESIRLDFAQKLIEQLSPELQIAIEQELHYKLCRKLAETAPNILSAHEFSVFSHPIYGPSWPLKNTYI